MGRIKTFLGYVGSIGPAESLRPAAYEDPDKFWFRGCLFVLWLVLMTLITAGLITYRLLIPGSVSVQVDNPTMDTTTSLFQKASDGIISNVNCPCTGASKTNDELKIDLPSDEWDNLQTACQDAVGTNDFRGFCAGMWYNIGVVWKRQTVSSGSLLENSTFVGLLESSFYTACSGTLDDMNFFRLNLWLYFINAGVDTTAVASGGSAEDFFDGVRTAFQTNGNCELTAYPTTPISDFYKNYFDACAVKTCTYTDKETTLASVLWAIGILGTVWGIGITIVAIIYGVFLQRCFHGGADLPEVDEDDAEKGKGKPKDTKAEELKEMEKPKDQDASSDSESNGPSATVIPTA